MTTPTDYSSDLDHARDDLREGIENSRQLVRQSRLLIELTQSDGAAPRDEEESWAIN